MKRLVYKKDTYGKAFFTEQKGYDSNIGCNSLKIEDAVINELVAKGKIKRLGYNSNRNVFNEWYEVQNMSIVKVSYLEPGRESFFIFDRVIHCNGSLNGTEVKKCINNKIISVPDANSDTKKRRRPFISLPNVVTKNKKGSSSVNIATYLYYLSQWLVTGTDDELNIIDKEAHHLGYDFDNRITRVRILTKQQHKEIHKKVGKGSHQVQVWIKTEEEFLEFIKYMNSYNEA